MTRGPVLLPPAKGAVMVGQTAVGHRCVSALHIRYEMLLGECPARVHREHHMSRVSMPFLSQSHVNALFSTWSRTSASALFQSANPL